MEQADEAPLWEMCVVGTLVKTRLGRAAVQSGLLSEAKLEAIERELLDSPGSPRLTLEERLAKTLVAEGHATSYQVAQLTAGRAKLNLGPYVVTDWLGQGGMGQVFKAVHPLMGREVAIKVLPQVKSTDAAESDFRREIRMQAKLDHPNLVRAYDAGHDGNVYFLVTEFVEGTDLRRLVKSRNRLTVEQAAHIVAQAADALAYAHERGLVHRDVKPGNILVRADGKAKLADLGLSGFQHEEDPRLGKIVGTADFLAPEHIRNPSTHAPLADIYSLGCTLYYAVTGKVPFPGGTTREKVKRHLDDTPWHPRRFNPSLHDDFVDLIADMMEKEPQKRLQNAGDVAERLLPWARFRSHIGHSSPRHHSPWQPAPVPGQATETSPEIMPSSPDPSDRDEPSVLDSDKVLDGESVDRTDTELVPPPLPSSQPPNSAAPPLVLSTTTQRERRGIRPIHLAWIVPCAAAIGAAAMWWWLALEHFAIR